MIDSDRVPLIKGKKTGPGPRRGGRREAVPTLLDYLNSRTPASSSASSSKQASLTRGQDAYYEGPIPQASTLIINLGLPKSGSTTLFAFLRCGGVLSSRWTCGRSKCGSCISKNIRHQRPPFLRCGNFQGWTQLDVVEPEQGRCAMPQTHHGQYLLSHHPDALFLLPLRDKKQWSRSMEAWVGNQRLSLADRLAQCAHQHWQSNVSELQDFDLQANMTRKTFAGNRFAELQDFYEAHTRSVKMLKQINPNMRLLEYNISDPQQLLQALPNIPKTCYGHKNQGQKKKRAPRGRSLD